MIKTRNQDLAGDTGQMKNFDPFQFPWTSEMLESTWRYALLEIRYLNIWSSAQNLCGFGGMELKIQTNPKMNSI